MEPTVERSPRAAFELSDVSYSYENVVALCHVSLQIQAGERIALLGANGSGKSTLLRLLGGLAFARSGRVSFFGEELRPDRLEEAEFFYAFRRRVGILFQNSDVQLFNSSVFDEVAFGPLQLGWTSADVRRRVSATLESLGIESLSNRLPHRLSGGEKKRVALASVLVAEPEALLLDEPIAALDPSSQASMIDLLSSWAGCGRTIVTATHDLSALESIADRCIVLQNGKIAGEGDPFAVLHDRELLERTGLLRPHRHRHETRAAEPHGHLHTDDPR